MSATSAAFQAEIGGRDHDILENTAVKQLPALHDGADLAPDRVQIQSLKVLSVIIDCAAGRLLKAKQQAHEG